LPPGANVCVAAPGAVLGLYDGVVEEGLCGHTSPFSPSGVRGGTPAEITFSAFLPSKYTI